MTCLTRLIGTANPMFCASGKFAVLMPTTCPHVSTSGPPELPGLMAASVWIIGSVNDHAAPGSMRFMAETMPRVSD